MEIIKATVNFRKIHRNLSQIINKFWGIDIFFVEVFPALEDWKKIDYGREFLRQKWWNTF